MNGEKTDKGTEAMFSETNSASSRFFDKMADLCDASASVNERKQMRKKFSEEYYRLQIAMVTKIRQLCTTDLLHQTELQS